VNMCAADTGRFYQEAGKLLARGKPVSWGLVFSNGSTSFRVAKKGRKVRGRCPCVCLCL
jgi:hypothetical protein